MADTRRNDNPPLPAKRSSADLCWVSKNHLVLGRGLSCNDLPWSASPVPIKPLIQADFGIGTHDAVVFKLQEPLDTGQELVVEAHVGQGAIDQLLVRYVPGLGQDHEVQLADNLLVLDRGAPAQHGDALFGADEEEAPVGRHDGDHVEQLGHKVRHDAGLDDHGELGGIVGGAGVVGGTPVDLDGGDLLAGLVETGSELGPDHGLIVREEGGYPPSGTSQHIMSGRIVPESTVKMVVLGSGEDWDSRYGQRES